jgi:hypothetical protein
VVIATCAASLGDNIGFALGHYGGRPLLERYRKIFRVSQEALERGEKLFARYGASTVFLARFIFGLRIFAGPLAGVLRMHWKEFALFNFLGAAVWVTVISMIGYFFGQHWDAMEHVLGRFNLVGGVLILFLIAFLAWLERGVPRPRLTLFAALAAATLPLALPYADLLTGRQWGTNSSTVGLVPWGVLRMATHSLLVVYLVLAAGAVVVAHLVVLKGNQIVEVRQNRRNSLFWIWRK